MPGFTITGYIYVYYPDSEGNYVDDYDDSSEEEVELKPNERELVLFKPHPNGVTKECYPVRDYENIDDCLMKLRTELLLL